jgi:peptide/nickel transport system substrate-binding protein
MSSRNQVPSALTRRQVLALAGAGALAGPAALAAPRRAAAQAAKSVETLKVAISGDPGNLHPWITNGMPQFSTFWPTIYESVLWHDDRMNLVPNLAEKWEVSGSDIKLTLKKGVTYHNGKPLDAESVKYAVEQITAPTSKSLWKSMVNGVKRTTIHDKQTITLHMEKPYRSVLMNLVTVALVEPGHAQAAGDKLGLQPVGTGPYRFVEYVPGSHLIVERNDRYHGAKPAIPRIHFRWIAENGTRLSALESGEVHFINNVPPDQVSRVEGNERLKLLTASTARIIYMGIRCDRPPFTDKRVRQALNFAVDREAITKAIMRGKAQPATSPIAPMILGGDAKLPPYNHDPGKARALLKAAGAEGATVNLGAPNGRYIMDRQVAEAVQGYLEKVGLKVTLEVPEWGAYVTEFLKGDKMKYDLHLLGWGVITMEPDYQARDHYHTANNKRWNACGSPALDKMIDDAAVLMDRSQAREAYHKIFAAVWDEAPWLFLHYQPELIGTDRRLAGFTPLADEWLRFSTIDLPA